MTNKQESYEKMSVASASFLFANHSITSELPSFSKYFTIVNEANGRITILATQQEMDKSGNSKNKNLLRATLVAQSMDVARKTTAYATNENDNVLLALVNYCESDLTKCSDTKMIGISQVICDSANAHIEALNTYSVSPASITTLQQLITDYSEAIPKVRIGKTDSTEATKQLAEEFKLLLTTWAKIDTLIEMLCTSSPAFYNEYQNVRKIIDTGVGYLSVKGSVTDAVSGEPIKGVTVEFYASRSRDLKPYLVKKTADKGGLNINSMPVDTYRIVAKKEGYVEHTSSLSVNDGETSFLNISITKV